MARIELDHLREIADRAIGISLLQIGETTAQQIVDLLRIDLDRPIEVGDGGVDVAPAAMGVGEAAAPGAFARRPLNAPGLSRQLTSSSQELCSEVRTLCGCKALANRAIAVRICG